jgi:hypothetical protein
MRPSEQPLDEAERLARELADYDDRDEITANVNLNLTSHPDIEQPAKKQLNAALIAVGSGAALALLGWVAAALQHCGK